MNTAARQPNEDRPREWAARTGQSRAWFPGRYVPIRMLQGLEVFPPQRRGCVQVSRTTLHGTASELRVLAWQMLQAAAVLEGRRPAG